MELDFFLKNQSNSSSQLVLEPDPGSVPILF
jgi:hypothetical protein